MRRKSTAPLEVFLITLLSVLLIGLPLLPSAQMVWSHPEGAELAGMCNSTGDCSTDCQNACQAASIEGNNADSAYDDAYNAREDMLEARDVAVNLQNNPPPGGYPQSCIDDYETLMALGDLQWSAGNYDWPLAGDHWDDAISHMNDAKDHTKANPCQSVGCVVDFEDAEEDFIAAGVDYARARKHWADAKDYYEAAADALTVNCI